MTSDLPVHLAKFTERSLRPRAELDNRLGFEPTQDTHTLSADSYSTFGCNAVGPGLQTTSSDCHTHPDRTALQTGHQELGLRRPQP